MEIPTSKPTLIPMGEFSIEVLKLLIQIDSYQNTDKKSITTLFQYNAVTLFFYLSMHDATK